MYPTLLENDSIMKTFAQEVEIIELNLEQLEAIQGVSWLSKLLDKLEVKIEKLQDELDVHNATKTI
jgi:cell division septal protein FtsQ